MPYIEYIMGMDALMMPLNTKHKKKVMMKKFLKYMKNLLRRKQ